MRRLIRIIAMSSVSVSCALPEFAQAQVTDNDGAQLGDIVVTAQKRDQNLQDIPVAVTVMSSAALENRGLKSLDDLTTAVPGLQIGTGPASMLPFLRGIGTNATSPGNEASIATYIDGVYFSALPAGFFTLTNIQRVEVLKGPQGTLFGRNSSGGVIQIVTKDPSVTPGANGSLSYGAFDTIEGDAFIEGGFSDSLTASISVAGRHQGEGFGKNITTGKKNNYINYYSARGKIVWKPSEEMRVVLAPFYGTSQSTLTGGTYPGTIAGYQSAPFTPVPTVGFYDTLKNDVSYAKNKVYGGSVTLQQDIGIAQLTSITGYLKSTNANYHDSDNTERPDQFVFYNGILKQTTQELQLSSTKGSPLEWVLGFFYYNQDLTVPVSFTGPLAPLGPGGGFLTSIKVNSYSGYGQATFEIAPDLKLTGGLRYSSDKNVGRSTTTIVRNPVIVLQAGPGTRKVEKLSYKASIDYRISPSLLIYATTSRGYKSGLFNTVPYNGSFSLPEVLTDYEIGFKSDLFDRRARFNGAVFYYDVENPQTQILINNAAVFSNAQGSRVYGIEFDSQVVLTPELSARLAATWLDSKYNNFKNAPSSVPIFVPPYGNAPVVLTDVTGNYTVQAPKFTLAAGFDYVVPTQMGELAITGDYFYNDGFYWEPNNLIHEGAYHLISGSIRLAVTDNLSVKVWGKNLLDEKYATRTGAQSRAGYPLNAGPPRTYGVTVGFNF